MYNYSPQAGGRIGGGGGYGGAPGQPGGAQAQQGPWGTMGGANGMNAWGVNDATAQMGMQFGRSAMVAGTEYMEKNVSACTCSFPIIRDVFQSNP